MRKLRSRTVASSSSTDSSFTSLPSVTKQLKRSKKLRKSLNTFNTSNTNTEVFEEQSKKFPLSSTLPDDSAALKSKYKRSSRTSLSSSTSSKVSNKQNEEKLKKSLKKSKRITKDNTLVSSGEENFIKLSEKHNNVSLDKEEFPVDLYESPASSLDKTLTKSDSIITENQSAGENNETFIKMDHSLLEKDNHENDRRDTFCIKSDEENRRGTFQIKNGSGQWSVIDISDDSVALSDTFTIENNNSDSSNKKEKCEFKKVRKGNLIEDNSPVNKNKVTLHPKKDLSQKKDVITLHSNTSPNESQIKGSPNNSKPKMNLEETVETPSKNRKKWVKFLTPTTHSPLLRHTTYSEMKSSDDFKTSSPIEAKKGSSSKKQKLVKSSKKENSFTTESEKKTFKPTTMPNFIALHKRVFDKMESIKDYSERKQLRAKQLMSGEKPSAKPVQKENKNKAVKSSNELFGTKINKPDPTTHSRFGFKLKTDEQRTPKQKKETSIRKTPHPEKVLKTSLKGNLSLKEPKKVVTGNIFSQSSVSDKPKEKPVPVFSRGHFVAAANKMKVQEKLGNRENRREYVKGIRTNKRFDLLMKMREKE